MSDLYGAAFGNVTPPEKEALNVLLQDNFYRILNLPAPLEQDFRHHYRRRAADFLRHSVFGLIAIYMLVVWPIWLFSHAGAMPTWKAFAMLPIGVVLVALWLSTKLPFMDKHVNLTLSFSLTFCLFGTMYCAMLLGNQYLGQMAAYETIYILFIGFAILRLPTRLALFCSALAFLLGLSLVLLEGIEPSWSSVLLFVGVPLIICTVGGYLLEHAERRNFVQSRLLQLQAEQLEGLNHLARRDALSGLANRRHLDETLQLEWDRARRDQQSLALIFIDVDYFKRYNDNYGHTAGDKCLALIGRALGESLHRPADLAARYGGEEFVLLLPGTDHEGALKVAERIIKQVDALALPHGNSPIGSRVTVSMGVAGCVPIKGTIPQMLIDLADEALYRSKSAGRHRITVADSVPLPAEVVAPV